MSILGWVDSGYIRNCV